MQETYNVTHSIKTLIKRIRIGNDAQKYISLPVNSEFTVPDYFQVYGYDAFGHFVGTIPLNSLTITGYDMSTVGWQDLTASYTNYNGEILTVTLTLHVYGNTTWRTIWEGPETIEFKNYGNWDVAFAINDIRTGDQRSPIMFMNTPTANLTAKDIGVRVTRKLRLTCKLEDTTLIRAFKVFGQSLSINTNTQTVTFDYNSTDPDVLDHNAADTTYEDVMTKKPLFAVDKRHSNPSFSNDSQVMWGSFPSFGFSNIYFENKGKWGDVHLELSWRQGAISADIYGQKITLIKLEVLE